MAVGMIRIGRLSPEIRTHQYRNIGCRVRQAVYGISHDGLTPSRDPAGELQRTQQKVAGKTDSCNTSDLLTLTGFHMEFRARLQGIFDGDGVSVKHRQACNSTRLLLGGFGSESE